ncbi:MAG: hypothetical protein KJS64_04330 [Acidobacteria bacterium]|nr:hypothetical protein [Acidobacteriota bacterium]
MSRLLRSGLLAVALTVSIPGIALAADCSPCPAPTVTIVEPGVSMIYVEWSSDIADVVDYTVTLSQRDSTVDEQVVSGDVTAATFFGVAEGSDYVVTVTANTATDSYSSLPSESVAVTESYIVVDPPVHVTTKLDPSTVTLTLSEDESTWIVEIPAIDQGGKPGIYGVVTSDGGSCWGFSASDTSEGDLVSCGIEVQDPLSTPEVTAAYYQEDYVMYALRDASGVTTTIEGVAGPVECSVTTPDDVATCETISPQDVPTPYDDVLLTSTTSTPSPLPGTAVSVAVAVLGLLAIGVVMRPRRQPTDLL